MADSPRNMRSLDLIGGSIALDFANTGERFFGTAVGVERLVRYEDLVTFGRRTGLLSDSRAERLREEARRRPADAEAVVARARILRDTLYTAFARVAHEGGADAESIEVLNSFLAEGLRYRRLEPDDRCCGWTWSAGDEPLAQMLWPIANSAAELLVDGELERIKLCGNERCAWLFLDLSRNRSRRWCDMKDCGNRAKARRHYARRKGA